MSRLKAGGAKLWFDHINVQTGLDYIMTADHAYIVEEDFLVVYALGCPWYSDSLFLQEMLVLRLAVSGAEFKAVPAFLERKARDAGAVMVCVGTAMSPSDAALASFYQPLGYRPEAITLSKETLP